MTNASEAAVAMAEAVAQESESRVIDVDARFAGGAIAVASTLLSGVDGVLLEMPGSSPVALFVDEALALAAALVQAARNA